MRKFLARITRALQRKLFVRVCIASGTVMRPGDTLILRTDVHLADEEIAIIRANFAEKFPGVGFVRLSADSDIAFVCHPVTNGSGDNGADNGGKGGCSQRMAKEPQPLEPLPKNTKDSDANNNGLPDFVLNDLRSQADRASSNFEHVTLHAEHSLRDAIVTDKPA